MAASAALQPVGGRRRARPWPPASHSGPQGSVGLAEHHADARARPCAPWARSAATCAGTVPPSTSRSPRAGRRAAPTARRPWGAAGTAGGCRATRWPPRSRRGAGRPGRRATRRCRARRGRGWPRRVTGRSRSARTAPRPSPAPAPAGRPTAGSSAGARPPCGRTSAARARPTAPPRRHGREQRVGAPHPAGDAVEPGARPRSRRSSPPRSGSNPGRLVIEQRGLPASATRQATASPCTNSCSPQRPAVAESSRLIRSGAGRPAGPACRPRASPRRRR